MKTYSKSMNLSVQENLYSENLLFHIENIYFDMQLLKNFEVKTLDVRIWDICTCSLWKINPKLWMLKFHNLAKFLTISLLKFKIIYGCSKLLMRFPLVSLFLHFFAISNYNLYLWEDWYFPFFLLLLLFRCLHLLLLLPNTTQARFHGWLLGSILPAGLFFYIFNCAFFVLP